MCGGIIMKKGYTLVELLGVFVVLGIIVTVASIIIINIVKNTNAALETSTETLLYTAAVKYLYDNYELPSNGNYDVTVGTLINNDLISNTFLESQTNSHLTENSCVKITIINNVMNYEFSYSC